MMTMNGVCIEAEVKDEILSAKVPVNSEVQVLGDSLIRSSYVFSRRKKAVGPTTTIRAG